MNSPGYSVGAASGPPPPPPPPVPGQVPALRINTASEFGPRKPQPGPQDSYEPPLAIQNAMMTKDKKPFTYTPGMGGKLDLSQIRSPRMARRVAKNANDEGIEGPPKSALAQQPQQPHQPSGIYVQPQVAVPVLPQGMAQQPPIHLRNSTLPRSLPGGGIIIPVIEKQPEPAPPRPVVKVETKFQPSANSPEAQTPPMSPTQVTLSKAPTPWMQKQAKSPEELPEWAKRTKDSPTSDSCSSQGYEFPTSPAPPRQIVVVTSPKQQTQPPQYQPQQQQQQQMRPVRQESNERTVPIRIEDRPSVFTAMNESGHHQLMNTQPHHQSRWGNPVGQSGYQPQPQQQSQGGTHIIPIQFEGQPQYQVPNNQSNRNVQWGHVSNQAEPGPVQSKSFRVLQKITDTDSDQINEEHLRKLQLTEDDRYLMNKFKEQVDGETYLHKEEDPRYRGAAIPSRAFRYLQNMTDSGDSTNTNATAAKTVSPATKKQNRNSKTFDEVTIPVQYIPASQQQVPEPKKYMGGAIPSRSFKILQAMTAPESIATQVTQENRQHSATDFINMPGNQQGLYCPTHSYHPIPPAPGVPLAFWNPETGWWSYYSTPPPQPPPLSSSCEPSHYPQYYDNHHHHHLHHLHHHDHHSSQLCSIDGSDYASINNSMSSLDYDSRASELSDYNSDEYVPALSGNPFSRNSDLYAGSQWRCNFSTTPTSCTTTTTDNEPFDKYTEEQPLTSSSPLSSLSSEDESEEEAEEDNCCSKTSNGQEQSPSVGISGCSRDSDSYVPYSTLLNPSNKKLSVISQKDVEVESKEKYHVDRDSTDCENESLSKEDQKFHEDTEEEERENEEEEEREKAGAEDNKRDDGTNQLVNEESSNNMTISVSLPLRVKFAHSKKSEDMTIVTVDDTAKDVEMCVAFTLKKPNQFIRKSVALPQEIGQIKPTFIVTTTDEDRSEINNSPSTDAKMLSNTSTKDKRKSMLSVQNHSKEDVTDDDDSGVTSDVSRIISEVDTDSECCSAKAEETMTTTTAMPASNPVTRRANSGRKYYRTQTHSRLFRLLNDEQLLGGNLSSHDENSSNSSGLASPDSSHLDGSTLRTDDNIRHELPKRPKSLDCEALFRRQKDADRDSYYQSWKNGGERSSRMSLAGVPTVQWACPRVNVLCPRIKSTKNVESKSSQRLRSPLGPTTISSRFPSPVGMSKRC